MILIAGSMICSTSSPIRRSCWSPGIGRGATRVLAPPEWTVKPCLYVQMVRGVEVFLDELRAQLQGP